MNTRKAIRTALCGAAAFALAGSGPCPGDTGEGILYCFVVNSLLGEGSGIEDCYNYDDYSPGEFRAVAQYAGDLRAYQELERGQSAVGPAMPTPRQFMSARYPDWAERSDRVRTEISAIRAARLSTEVTR
jgi:hypothetical protein